MPAIHGSDDPQRQPVEVPSGAFRVLVTGFGPFLNYEENPSWLAVKPLQNTVLHTDIHIDKIIPKTTLASPPIAASVAVQATLDIHTQPRPIHITTLQIPVTYDSVLAVVPGLHARPPVLPPGASEDSARPPASNYDFVFHIGVAGRGPLRMERIAHKLGYQMKDATGKFAPVVKVPPKYFSRRENPAIRPAPTLGSSGSGGMHVGGGNLLSAAEIIERERLGIDHVEGGDTIVRPTRGFGATYGPFPDEIMTNIDVTRLVHDLKRSGVEQIYTSMDAGHYLCDFIYYCSLAEVKRSTKPYEKRRNTQVLFLHCPPVNQPLSTEEVTDAIKRIVVWVCGEQQLDDAKDEAVVVA